MSVFFAANIQQDKEKGVPDSVCWGIDERQVTDLKKKKKPSRGAVKQKSSKGYRPNRQTGRSHMKNTASGRMKPPGRDGVHQQRDGAQRVMMELDVKGIFASQELLF